ncbi:recombinase family protein [Thermoactinomyces sp. CICC 10523]|jgi:site-specific DNA recombinase|uniref:recombinase family protein n=1 Tax=Thermoactinomyces sp. CICC 10523 TaxID=2767428 RepID=UPI0018DDDE28|nr:recombinase family protein [Thermoactinomyces sp. CICC 10523]MBH8597307.1 recombinase family protein [Thermoactinomyces sp. CICC 10523]
MKVAVYARVSTELQASEGTSLESQIEMCINKAHSLGLHHIEIYKEKGVSGEDINRPEMDRLRQDVADGKISHVICVHPDRLSRDMTDKLLVCREFERKNVELIFCDTEYQNTPEGQLFFNMQSAIAQYELSLIRKRTIRGRLRAVEKQKKIMPMRCAPFGYDLVNGKLVINEEEAKIVRNIYQWYVHDHLTLRQIGNCLVQLGVMPKRKESKHWHQSSINRILTNEIYIGIYRYNRRKTKKLKGEKTKSGNPKKTYDYRDESQWVSVEVPAIIDKSLFGLAQEQRRKNLTNSGNVKHEYLLKGMIRCGHCGRIWSGTTYTGRKNKQTGRREKYRCYRCPNKNPRKYGEGVMKCPTQTLRAELIEDYIWNLILQMLTDREEIRIQIEKSPNSLDHQIKDTIEVLKERIDKKKKEREKVKIMFRRELISEEEMIQDLSVINKELKALKTEVDKLQKHLSENLKNQEAKERVKKVMAYLEKLVNSETDVPFEKKRMIIQSLIDEIILTFSENNEQCEITCVGYLDTLMGQKMYIDSSPQHQEI